MNKNNEFLGTEPIGKLLVKLAVPTVTAQLINMLYNIVDRIYIGHMPGDGDLALTGLGICLPIIMIVAAFAALVSSGGATRASIYMGRGDINSAEKTLGGCLSLQVVTALIITAIQLIWGRDLLMAFGGTVNTIDYATSYLNIYALGTLFVQVTLGMNFYITAQGFAKIGMRTVMIGAVSNIILDPIFIFAFHMGVRGAALATVISQGISCVWVMLFLCGRKTVLHIRRKNLIPDFKIILPCLALGLSPFIMQSSESIIMVCFNASLRDYGGDLAVGAMAVLSSVMQFAMLPLMGLGQGAQPITGYNYGAKNADRVKKTFFLLLKVSMIYATTLWLLVMLFPSVFASVFTPKPELVEFASKALRIYCGAVLIFGVQMSCQMTFVAIGNAKSSIIVAVVRKFVLLLPLIYIMPHLMADKTMAVYTAEPVADILAVIVTASMFFVQFRKSLRSISSPQIDENK